MVINPKGEHNHIWPAEAKKAATAKTRVLSIEEEEPHIAAAKLDRQKLRGVEEFTRKSKRTAKDQFYP